MNPKDIDHILEGLLNGSLTRQEATQRLEPTAKLGFARLDLTRHARTGMDEVVFGQGKSLPEIQAIIQAMQQAGKRLLVTRVDPVDGRSLATLFDHLQFDEQSCILMEKKAPARISHGFAAILSAGVTDGKVAMEAKFCLEFFGGQTQCFLDMGIAGLHRLIHELDDIKKAECLIVVAGMDGLLPSLVAGLVSQPVIATPTSVGYGAGAGGMAPLLTMLNSCAPGVSVVNIDNGFGAAAAAFRILQSTLR